MLGGRNGFNFSPFFFNEPKSAHVALSKIFNNFFYQTHRRKPLALAMGLTAGIVSVAICQIIQYINYDGSKGDNPVFHP